MPFRLPRVTPASHNHGGKRKKRGDQKQTFYKMFVLLLHTFSEYFAAYVFSESSLQSTRNSHTHSSYDKTLTNHLFNQLEIHILAQSMTNTYETSLQSTRNAHASHSSYLTQT